MLFGRTHEQSKLCFAIPDSSRIFSRQYTISAGTRMDTDVMTIREVAEYLKLTEKTAYRLAADGTLPGFKVGGAWRFRRRDIDAWIEVRKRQSTGGEASNRNEDN